MPGQEENKEQKYVCGDATYKNSNLEDFVKHCAPENWKDFFQNDMVIKAITAANRIRYVLNTEVNALKNEEKEIQIKKKEFIRYHIEPPIQLMFEAFRRVSPEMIKVVILGQDPTPQEGKATGRAFSVKADPRTVGSVMNVLLEVALEGWSVNLSDGDLSKWEEQGVLLLNSALTIGEIEYSDPEDGITKRQQVSHLSYWCPFTKLLINYISNLPKPSVWMLWGKVAQDFTVDREFKKYGECFNYNKASKTDITTAPSLISKPKNYVLKGGHPSPLSGAGGMNTFFAGNYFYCASKFLSKKRGKPIDWGLVDDDICDVGSYFLPCPDFE